MDKTPIISELKGLFNDERLIPLAIYALLFFMSMSAGATGVVAIVLIYLYQDRGTDLTRSHYVFQKRTFWAGMIGLIIALVLSRLGLAPLALLVGIPTFIWVVCRCVMGFNHLFFNRPHPKPTTNWA
jgi:uncharacterized membrane protein